MRFVNCWLGRDAFESDCLAGQTQPFIASVHQAGAMPRTPRNDAAGTSYPSLWRTWNSRCMMSLTGAGDVDEERPGGPTKELIRGSPIPVRSRDDDGASSPPPGAGAAVLRKFTMDQFQKEFGPCLTYTAPASPLHKRLSVESSETIPPGAVLPRRAAKPPTAATAAAAGVPATLGRGGWRPVTGQFSLDSSSSPSLPRRSDDRRFESSTLPLARKPLSALDNLPDVRKPPPSPPPAVTLPEPVDQSGMCCCYLVVCAIRRKTYHQVQVQKYKYHVQPL